MFLTREDLINCNERTGGAFFTPPIMRKFDSRISQNIWNVPGGAVFITSERYRGKPQRFYAVRFIWETSGHVRNLGSAFTHLNMRDATRAAREYVRVIRSISREA